MDDDEDIQYSARGVAADPDDVLFRAAVEERSRNMMNMIAVKRLFCH